MSLRSWQVVTLLPATLTMGLTAGVFGLYAHTIMRGLHGTDDRTFVGAFQAIDRAIINPLFMLTFFGALVLSGVAAVLYLRDDDHSVLPCVAMAFGLYLAAVIITMAVHVPLNDDIKAAGDPDSIVNLGAVRDAFHETRWVAWNIVRTIATTAAFVCLAWALVLHGRATPDNTDTTGDHAARPAEAALVPPGATPKPPLPRPGRVNGPVVGGPGRCTVHVVPDTPERRGEPATPPRPPSSLDVEVGTAADARWPSRNDGGDGE